MPGRHITVQQMRLFMTLRQTQPVPVAAAKAGFSQATGYRLQADPILPSHKKASRGRRRPDPLSDIFDTEVLPLLKSSPGLRPVAIFDVERQPPCPRATTILAGFQAAEVGVSFNVSG